MKNPDFVRHREILDPDRLAHLLAQGFNPNLILPVGVYPLELAAWGHSLRSCDMLLEAGAKINATQEGVRPSYVMTYAVKGVGELNQAKVREICLLLLDHGADINGPHTVHSPMHFAAKENNHHAVRLLLDLGGDVNHVAMAPDGSNRVTVIERACWARHEALMLMLLQEGADDSGLGQGILTPFQECVRLGLSDVIRYYVEVRGESLTQKTKAGKSMIQFAPADRTKQLLRSLKSSAAIAGAVRVAGDGGEKTGANARRSGMSPL